MFKRTVEEHRCCCSGRMSTLTAASAPTYAAASQPLPDPKWPLVTTVLAQGHVADRWHLLENCSAAVLEAVKRNMPALRAAAQPTTSGPTAVAITVVPAADPDAPPTLTSAQRLQYEGWQRRIQVHGEVKRLHEQGVTVRQIAREFALSRKTVRRWMRG